MRSGLYYIVLMMVVMVTGCHDERDSGGNIIGPSENGKLTVSFTMQLPANSSGISTYGKTINEENAISQVDVLAFKHSGGDEYFAYHVEATDIQDAKTDGSEKTMQVKVEESNDTYTYVVLANVRSELTALGTIPATRKKEEVLADLVHTHAGEIWDTAREFPMWGETSPVVITAGTHTVVKVSMLRMVARIDVTASVDISTFEMTDIYVYNVHTHGHIVPDAANYDATEGKVTAVTIPAVSAKSAIPAHYEHTSQQFIREIYIYESPATDVHKEKTCLVIGGKYKGAADPTYYRVDIVDTSGKDLYLLRNHWYTINITGVKGEGYPGPGPAFEAVPVDMEVDVMEWNQGGIRDIIFNGQYFLGVSESEIYMPAPAADTSIIVTTNYPDCWQATFEPSTDWLTHVSGSCTGLEKKEELVFHLTENTGDAMRTGYIYLKAGPLTHTIKVYQDIADGGETEPDDVYWKEEGEANCYILSPTADGIVIPVSQANKDGVPRIGANDELEVELLWTDTPYPYGHDQCVIRYIGVDGKGTDGVIKVAANNVLGNALVGIKVDGEIKWSWHIWVLEYQPDETAIKYPENNPTIIFMDRNLGALSGCPEDLNAGVGDPKSMGLTYQWGRKDPFPGLNAFSSIPEAHPIYNVHGTETNINYIPVNTSLNNMLEESIKNPMTYIQGYTAGSNDWYSTSQAAGNDNLWKSGTTDVSPYDPCPAGWTADITKSFWDSNGWAFTLTYPAGTYGSYHAAIGFWPLGGFRNPDGSFDVSEMGTLGYYWLGETNGSYGATLKLGATANYNGISPAHTNFRSMGLSVRCIKHGN